MILPVFLSTLKHISFRAIGYSINLIRNLIGRELDVIHESLLRLMSAYMHHLQNLFTITAYMSYLFGQIVNI